MVYGQSVKNKQDKLLNANGDEGIVNYTFYENSETGDYVPHGSFSFKLSKGSYYKEVVSGSLKHGKRDGIWSSVINRLDDYATGVYWTGLIQLKYGYKAGKPNGIWSYSNNQKYRAKTISGWQPYESDFAPKESATMSFSNGTPVGKFVINKDGSEYKYDLITGEFSNGGLMNGAWLFKSSSEQFEYIFNNGICTKYIYRELPAGRVKYSFNMDSTLKEYAKNFVLGKISISELNKIDIIVDTVDAKEVVQYKFDVRRSFYNRLFNWDNIGGDDLYETTFGNGIGAKCILFRRKEKEK